jgi:hypothetical protein
VTQWLERGNKAIHCIQWGIETKISFIQNIGSIIKERLTDEQINDLYMETRKRSNQKYGLISK